MPLVRSTDHNRQARARGEAALLAAVEDLVAGGTPYSELGVSQITERSGFSRATFYSYFTDKRALALRLSEQVQEALDAEVSPWLVNGEGDLRETLARALAVFTEHRGATQTVAEAAAYDSEIAAAWRAIHAQLELSARGRIHDALPHLPESAVAARAFVLVWGTQASFIEHIAADRTNPDALLDALTLQWQAALTHP